MSEMLLSACGLKKTYVMGRRTLEVLRGVDVEIARGDVPRIVGASPRTGQKVTAELLTQRLVTSSSPKGPLRLGFPADAAGYYFPNLYPAGADWRSHPLLSRFAAINGFKLAAGKTAIILRRLRYASCVIPHPAGA